MKATSFYTVAEALSAANVRFIVGGLAVIEHGYLRATRDANIVIQLLPENIRACFEALEGIGYRPTVPITAGQFADPDQRRCWREEKHMRILQFWSDSSPDMKLDVFLEHPLPDSMKKAAARPRDRIGIEYLEKILTDRNP